MATGLATTLPSSPAPWAARPAHGRPLAHGPAGISAQTECRGTPRGRPALPAISESLYASHGLGAPPENCRLACASPHSEGEFWNGRTACSQQASVWGRGEAPTQDCPLAACPVPPCAPRVPCRSPGHTLGDGEVRAALRGECGTPRRWAAWGPMA